MSDHMHTGTAEATRLTQQGRLDEARAAIQRALGGTFAPAAQEDPGDTNEPIEVISRLVRATPQGQAGARRTAVRRPGVAAWTTPGLTLLTRVRCQAVMSTLGSPTATRRVEISWNGGACAG
jgi:hypothetical protein